MVLSAWLVRGDIALHFTYLKYFYVVLLRTTYESRSLSRRAVARIELRFYESVAYFCMLVTKPKVRILSQFGCLCCLVAADAQYMLLLLSCMLRCCSCYHCADYGIAHGLESSTFIHQRLLGPPLSGRRHTFRTDAVCDALHVCERHVCAHVCDSRGLHEALTMIRH